METLILGDSNVVRYLPKLKETSSDPSIQSVSLIKTTNEVLLRDADPNESVQFTSRNKCMVYKAKWIDPFSGAQFKLANAIQVDHIVPLKAAYLSGAHAWNQNRRCRYANFMDDPTHLLSVSGHENMSKGDAGPERYLPPDTGSPASICIFG